ncbi:hypothetical protein [Acutalibacter sp. 1XD8-33]|uniref:hypothetical protein n=1 Tax=Acutalibacter sp. 1XD8-33 TaxID=2320081 RepID=UPI002679A9A6
MKLKKYRVVAAALCAAFLLCGITTTALRKSSQMRTLRRRGMGGRYGRPGVGEA